MPVQGTRMGAGAVPGQEEFQQFVEQLPVNWKTPLKQFLTTSISMYVQLSNHKNSIQHIDELQGLINSTTPPDMSKVNSLLDNLSNMKEACKNAINSYFCTDKSSCQENFEVAWQKAQTEVLEQLRLEKVEAANNCVKGQLISAAVIIVLECEALCSIFQDIENAENVMRQCRDADLPAIRARITMHQTKETELRALIETFLSDVSDEGAKNRMHVVAFNLMADLIETREMIRDVKVMINNEVAQIGSARKDQLRRGVSNIAQAGANTFQYFRLVENLATPWKWVQGGMALAFALLAVGNATAYVLSGEKLKELQEIFVQLRSMELFVRGVMDVVRRAENLYMPG